MNRRPVNNHREFPIDPAAASSGSPATFTDLAPDRFDRRATEAARAIREQFLLRVLKQHGTDFPEDLLMAALREAEAVAGLTPFPELFLPSLAEEKVGQLQAWWTRQQRIRSQEIAFPA